LFKSFYSSGCIHHFPFTGEERMAFAAQLDVKLFFGGTGGKDIAAGAYNLRIRKIFGVNFLFHLIAQRKR
jgi:hypothetical protein